MLNVALCSTWSPAHFPQHPFLPGLFCYPNYPLTIECNLTDEKLLHNKKKMSLYRSSANRSFGVDAWDLSNRHREAH